MDTDPVTRGRRTPRRPILAAVTIVVASAVTLVVVLVGRSGSDPDSGYGPISAGGFYGIGGNVLPVSGTKPSRLGPEKGWPAYAYSSITIGGKRPIRVTSIEKTEILAGASWAPFPASDLVAVFDPVTRWHAFPATLPAGRVVQIRMRIHRPASCPEHEAPWGPVLHFDRSFRMHWKVPSGDRVTDVAGDSFSSIAIC